MGSGRVLIVRLGALGDLIHTLPLAADLAAAGWAVDWLCEERWAPLLRGSPVLDLVHGLPRRCRLVDYRRQGRRLRERGYAAVIDAQGLAKSAVWSLLAGAPQRIGHARPRAREGAWLAARRRVAPVAVHVIDQQRALALPLGVRAVGGWRFPLPAWSAQHAWAAEWLRAAGLDGAGGPWALNVGAGWPTKVWPQEQQRAWLAMQAAAGARPLVIWGSRAERAVAEALVAAVPAAVLAPPTDLPQLAALLSRCRLLVSGDTGPLHLAAAYGRPTVGLFGPVPRERNGPRGPGHVNLQAPGAAWERRRVELGRMGDLHPDAVQAAAQQALAGGRDAGS